ncbi:sigma 54-interacting transcriptional regulator [Oligoflexaceae bacterium]|nr:sigma 54-interacting transcriptional regulator [Oligoflexaceae bacterium]
MSLKYNEIDIIHVDDSLLELEQLEQLFAKDDVLSQTPLHSFSSGSAALAACDSLRPKLALIDIYIGEESGLDLVIKLRRRFANLVIIVRSNDAHQGVEAAKSGVDDYVTKDLTPASLIERLHFHLNAVMTAATAVTGDHSGYAVGKSIEQIEAKIASVNNSAVTSVHIKGDTGTGKEKVAGLFSPAVSIDCGALAESIIESELFGHKRGSFTGAKQDSLGLLDINDGAWVFLDEIGNISPKIQASLLRAIGEREIRPVGSRVAKKVNFKLISATNEDLAAKVEKGEFRADLYQRLTEYTIELQPLSERKNEIPQLIRHFCKTLPGGPYKVDAPASEVLSRYSYENGNIRELRRALVSMTVQQLADGSLPFLSIPNYIRAAAGEEEDVQPVSEDAKLELQWQPGKKWDDLANECLLAVIKKACASRPYSMRELGPIIGIQRSTLSRRIQDLHKSELLSEDEWARLLKFGSTERSGRKRAH